MPALAATLTALALAAPVTAPPNPPILIPGIDAADLCAHAPHIPGHGTYRGHTRSATPSPVSPTPCVPDRAVQGPDVWFAWTPVCSGLASLNTAGSGFDTVLSVHEACPDPAGGPDFAIACNDDVDDDDPRSALTFPYQAGATYYIRIAGRGADDAGDFILTLHEGPAPANDDPEGAIELIGEAASAKIATCRATSGGPAAGCAPGATIHNDVWFRHTLPFDGILVAQTCGSNFDTVLAIYPGDRPPLATDTPVNCNDDALFGCEPPASRLAIKAVAGESFYIRLGGARPGAGAGGQAVLSVRTDPFPVTCPADFNADGDVTSADVSAFLVAWFAALPTGDPRADIDDDNAVTSADIAAFLTRWSTAVAGGC